MYRWVAIHSHGNGIDTMVFDTDADYGQMTDNLDGVAELLGIDFAPSYGETLELHSLSTDKIESFTLTELKETQV